MSELLERIYRTVWGLPTLVLILGTGVYLTVRLRGAQLTLFPQSCRCFFSRLKGESQHASGVSPFQALCTALAATVGTGNLAGVAGAIAIGGPGAIFWMWICAVLGMAVKFAEATLAVNYRVKNKAGEYVGGPMYIIRQGMGKRWKWLAGVYSFFGVVAAFGVGNATQINTFVCSVNDVIVTFGGMPSQWGNLLMGSVLALVIAAMLLGGAARIGKAAELLIPFASLAYLLLGGAVIVLRAEAVPAALTAIVKGAFSPQAVTGGAVGSMLTALRTGVSRGVFTNEAGMGTASIAHAAAEVRHPAEQGLMGIMEVFLDTVVICTMTALVILCSGVQIPYGVDTGITLTTQAFSGVLGSWVSVLISVSLCLFAFATVLGWGLYGARCAQYLLGDGVWRKFVLLQAATVVLGAVLNTAVIWRLAETVNGLMAIPNLIALAACSGKLVQLKEEYTRQFGRHSAVGGYRKKHGNFNKREPVRAVPHAQVSSAGGRGGAARN